MPSIDGSLHKMETTCLVCAKPAQYTDGNNVYCGQLCQITGNLTVLMSSPLWNKDMFTKLIYHLSTDGKLRLIDSMLSDATDRQRQVIFGWMKELDIKGAIQFDIEDNLIYLMLHRPYSDRDLRVVIEYINIHLRNNLIPLPMFKVLLGKLIQHDKLSKERLVNYLVVVTIKNMPEYVQHLYTVANFADWVKVIIDGHLLSAKLLIEHGCDPRAVGEYGSSGLVHNLKDATGVFNDPGKRIKR